MNCSDFQELISAKLDKELTPEEEKILAEHLKTCTNCASFAKELEELEVIGSNWGNEQIPAELEKQILNRTVRTTPEKKTVFGFLVGHYKVPKSLAWVSILIFLTLLATSFLKPLSDFTGARRIEKPSEKISKIQKVILTESDVVRTYTTLGKRN